MGEREREREKERNGEYMGQSERWLEWDTTKQTIAKKKGGRREEKKKLKMLNALLSTPNYSKNYTLFFVFPFLKTWLY